MRACPSVRRDRADRRAVVGAVILTVAVVTLAAFQLSRYRGLWGEGDTAVFSESGRQTYLTGALAPPVGAYAHGYSYSALLATLAHVTGLNIAALQLYLSGLLAAWLVLPAWLAFRELTRQPKLATLATAILLVQPEFLFPVMRGTHEKFTRGLMLLTLYLLARSLRARDGHGPGRTARFAGLVVAFYLAAFSLITFNNLMAVSFITGTGLALFLLWAGWRQHEPGEPTLRRLAYAVLITGILALTVTLLLYEPARHSLLALEHFGQRLAALFLEIESASVATPYDSIFSGWIRPGVYLLLSLSNWLLLGVSALIWLEQTRALLSRGRRLEREQMILWAYYAAFAFIMAVSVALDWAGTYAGANFQLRAFPAVAMLAAPLVARWLGDRKSGAPGRLRLLRASVAIGIGLLALLSTLKLTNEPLLSNRWLFYSSQEMAAVRWADEKLAGRTLWTGYDDRLGSAIQTQSVDAPLSIRLDGWALEPEARDILVSNVVRAHGQRTGQLLPLEADSLLTYDNGAAHVYHLRPRTPFQR
jgi:hypothetical protein